MKNDEEIKKISKLIHFWEERLIEIKKFGDVTSTNSIQMTIYFLKRVVNKLRSEKE